MTRAPSVEAAPAGAVAPAVSVPERPEKYGEARRYPDAKAREGSHSAALGAVKSISLARFPGALG